jgi:UDP-N-acetylglucosamine diphosphorylase/glucosamine-1-phosphate N-acetyltransferase
MYICIFEDEFYRELLPLVYFKPVYDLKCGATTLREKILRFYQNGTFIFHVRDYLTNVLKEKSPGALINEIPHGVDRLLLINGRVLFNESVAKKVEYDGHDTVYMTRNAVAAAWISGKNVAILRERIGNSLVGGNDFSGVMKRELADVSLVRYPWELVSYNGSQLVDDFKILTNQHPRSLGKIHDGAHLLNPSQIFIDEGAKIMPGVVLDAEDGPIYISKGVKVMPNAVIQGPAFIGDGSIIRIGAKIYKNTTIGEICRIGGEVDDSIVHGYTNKQHDGFIGHSYLGEWVNVGANSNNSDLKNDYGNVKVYNDGAFVDTGLQFVGLTMGDHSKCGINSMFNTGTVVSVSCNVYGAGFLPKYVPPFTWGDASGKLVAYKIEKAIEVAKRVMARRNIKLSSATEQLFRKVFEMTDEERKTFGVEDIK